MLGWGSNRVSRSPTLTHLSYLILIRHFAPPFCPSLASSHSACHVASAMRAGCTRRSRVARMRLHGPSADESCLCFLCCAGTLFSGTNYDVSSFRYSVLLTPAVLCRSHTYDAGRRRAGISATQLQSGESGEACIIRFPMMFPMIQKRLAHHAGTQRNRLIHTFISLSLFCPTQAWQHPSPAPTITTTTTPHPVSMSWPRPPPAWPRW
jgi:hypothetical protein